MKFRSSAFTLIELALVLVIVSLMTGFGMQAVEGTAAVNCYETTQAQLSTIDAALKNYAANNQRFPKPAYMDRGSSSPDFGKEALDGVPDTAPGPTQYNSVAFGNAVPTGMASNSGILIGALPHAELGLSAQYAADCWGDKFTYAVTNSQTSKDNTSGYTSGTQGTIQLMGGTPSGAPFSGSPTTLSTNATYVVLSHGQDKYGATGLTTNNTTAKNCNSSTAAKVDRENCNSDNVFYNSMRSTGNTSNYFDDMLVFSSKTQSTEDCAGQIVNWGPSCTAASAQVLDGGTASLTNTRTNWTGHANVACHDGVLTTSAVDCYPSAPCLAQTASWGSGCSGWTGATIVHGQSPVTVNNSAVNKMGSANLSCSNGTLTFPGPNTCNPAPACNPGSIAWGPGNACTASIGSMTAGQVTPGVANTTSWYAGSTTVECRNTTNGGTSVFVLSDSNCVATPPSPCAAQAVTWGGCTGTAPAMAHNGSAGVSDSDAMKTGSGTATCYNGTSSATGSCYNDCAATTVNWGGGCSASFPQIAGNGASSTQANTAGGYTGSVTVSCNNGSPSQSGASCAAIVTGACGSANGTSGLSAPSSGLCNSGTPTAVSGSGPYSWQCQGANGGATASCTAHRSCTGSATWSSCAASYGTIPHANSTGVTNTNGGYTGSATVSCSEGTHSVSSPTCNTTATCAAGWSKIYHYSDEASYDCRAYDNTIGLCSGGESSHTASSRGNINTCIDPGSCVDARTCGCTGDGSAVPNHGYGPQPQLCCNGDSDGNGTCGTQATGCPAGFYHHPNGCDFNYPALTSGQTYSDSDCQPDSGAAGGGPSTGDGWNGNMDFTCSGTTISRSGACVRSCFLKDVTITMADGSTKLVSELKEGDKVRGHTQTNTVIKLPTFNRDTTIYGFNGSKAFVTGGHPFFTNDGWKAIEPDLTPTEGHNVSVTKLEVGDTLLLDDGSSKTITSIDPHPSNGEVELFNPAVNGDHTYYANGILVHNKLWLPDCGGGTACTNDGIAPGPDGCCNADTDGNGLCGFQCRANGQSSGGNASLCCSGDSDGNGICGTQASACGCGATQYTCTGSGCGPDMCAYINCQGYVGQSSFNWTCQGPGGATSCVIGDGMFHTCFLPDALITLADGSTKPVSDLKVGDEVKGQTRTNKVVKLPEFDVEQPVYGFNGGKKFVTGGHPFFTKDGWKAIDPSLTPTEGHNVETGKLEIGDVLTLDTGETFTLTSIDKQESAKHHVFNPMMDGDHTYYSNGLLVHNKQPDNCPEEPRSCGAPMNACAAQGLNEGEGNYDAGSCTLTSCCGGAIVTSNPPMCPAASYMGGSGNCGAPAGEPPGTVVATFGGDLVCSGGHWGANYNCNCTSAFNQCASHTGHMTFNQYTGGCSSGPGCSGWTAPEADCFEQCECVCN